MKNCTELINRMVDRFLSWKLPSDFSPECGISFNKKGYEQGRLETYYPTGTNLFHAGQAKAMIEYMLDGAVSEEDVEPVGEVKGKAGIVWSVPILDLPIGTRLYTSPPKLAEPVGFVNIKYRGMFYKTQDEYKEVFGQKNNGTPVYLAPPQLTAKAIPQDNSKVIASQAATILQLQEDLHHLRKDVYDLLDIIGIGVEAGTREGDLEHCYLSAQADQTEITALREQVLQLQAKVKGYRDTLEFIRDTDPIIIIPPRPNMEIPFDFEGMTTSHKQRAKQVLLVSTKKFKGARE